MNDIDRMTNELTSSAYNIMLKLRDDIKENIGRMGKRASGRTQDSLRVIVEGDTVTLVGRPFFPSLEYGNKPWSGATGVRCTWDEFREIIRQWVTDKGLSFGQAKEHERVIDAITATIIRRGSKLYRSNGYDDVYDTLIEQAVEDISDKGMVIVASAVDVIVDQWARQNLNN